MSRTRVARTAIVAVTGLTLIVPLTPAAAQTAPTVAKAAPATTALATAVPATAAPAAKPAPPIAAKPGPVVAPAYDQLSLKPAAGARSATLSAARTKPFAMVGVTWPYRSSSADVVAKVRVFSGGKWTAWEQLHVEATDEVAATEQHRARSGTEPFWVGTATGVQVSVTTADGATVRGSKVSLIQPGSRAEDATVQPEAVTAAADAGPRTLAASAAPYPMSPIVSRRGWGADERLRSYNGKECATPNYSRTVYAAFVHHTADTNSYSSAQVPAMLRSTLAYHVKSRGWCDIGYNFLVDKFGRAFEGRYGGMRLPVLGAHTGGYNTNSFGVSLIGNFDIAVPSAAMMERTAKIIAWKFDANYRGPFGTVVLSGKKLNTISGHRDTKSTACPGRYVYSKLGWLRSRVNTLMGGSVSTEISRYAAALGGPAVVGQPFFGEHAVKYGRGTWFEWRDLYWSPATGTRSVAGPFRVRHRSLGNADGILGMPSAAERNGVFAGVRVQNFRGGRLYRSNATAAQPVYGAILTRYLALGAERSRLGLPSGAPYRLTTGLKSPFQHGWIAWNTSTGKVTVTYKSS